MSERAASYPPSPTLPPYPPYAPFPPFPPSPPYPPVVIHCCNGCGCGGSQGQGHGATPIPGVPTSVGPTGPGTAMPPSGVPTGVPPTWQPGGGRGTPGFNPFDPLGSILGLFGVHGPTDPVASALGSLFGFGRTGDGLPTGLREPRPLAAPLPQGAIPRVAS